jgi:hypothetical protein
MMMTHLGFHTLPYSTKISLAIRRLSRDYLLCCDYCKNMNDNDFAEQEARIATYRESHFLPAAVLQQIGMFMTRRGG